MIHEGKAAIVTGGGQGIGKAIAKRLLKGGMQVIIAELDQESGEETESELKPFGAVKFISTDVANEEEENLDKEIYELAEEVGKLVAKKQAGSAGMLNFLTRGTLSLINTRAWQRLGQAMWYWRG